MDARGPHASNPRGVSIPAIRRTDGLPILLSGKARYPISVGDVLRVHPLITD